MNFKDIKSIEELVKEGPSLPLKETGEAVNKESYGFGYLFSVIEIKAENILNKSEDPEIKNMASEILDTMKSLWEQERLVGDKIRKDMKDIYSA